MTQILIAIACYWVGYKFKSTVDIVMPPVQKNTSHESASFNLETELLTDTSTSAISDVYVGENQSRQNAAQPTIMALKNVTVQRGDIPLCSGVTLTLHGGDICHLIGANGTGKTTLLMQLAGLLPVLKGDVFYLGSRSLPIAPVYVSHQLGINASLTVAQNLKFLLNLYGITPTKDDISKALAWVDLDGFEQISSNELSAGQTRRVTLARLYLMTPSHTPLWLLDEPFTALDVNMVAKLQTRLQQFAATGGSVLMTSHQHVDVVTKQLNLSDYLFEDSTDEFEDDETETEDTAKNTMLKNQGRTTTSNNMSSQNTNMSFNRLNSLINAKKVNNLKSFMQEGL